MCFVYIYSCTVKNLRRLESKQHLSKFCVRNTSPSKTCTSGFCGLEVACWPFVPKFAGSHPAEAVGFLGLYFPSFGGESKAVGLM
jgi:hypothetical protein